MNKLSEADLLAGAKAFDLMVLEAVYDRYSPGLYAYAMRLLGDPCLAEDCVAETFVRLLKGLQSGGGPSEHLQAYLYRIAHNWITDQYRRQAPPALDLLDSLPDGEDARPEPLMSLHLEQERVRSAMRLLTADQRQVIMLRFFEGWENEEVAAAVNKPVGAVKALQHRAVIALRKMLVGQKKEDGYEFEHGN